MWEKLVWADLVCKVNQCARRVGLAPQQDNNNEASSQMDIWPCRYSVNTTEIAEPDSVSYPHSLGHVHHQRQAHAHDLVGAVVLKERSLIVAVHTHGMDRRPPNLGVWVLFAQRHHRNRVNLCAWVGEDTGRDIRCTLPPAEAMPPARTFAKGAIWSMMVL